MELCNVLLQAGFATSKMKLDIKCNRLGTQVADQATERIKTSTLRKLINIIQISNLGEDSLVPSLPSRNWTLL